MEKWERQKLWVTPENKEHLNQLLNSYDGTEKAAAYNAAMFMWNFCVEQHNKEVKESLK